MKSIINPIIVLFSVVHHGLTVLSEKDKGPIFRAMRHGWQVSHGD